MVRVSGSEVPVLIEHWLGRHLSPRRAVLCDFKDASGTLIDQGLAIYFPAPYSYTGEAVLELQAHGNPVILEALIGRLVEQGVQRAAPGEFTQRAYLNERLDLAQAEAVADVIAAASMHSVRAAQRSLEGAFSEAVHALMEALVQLRVYVEAALDFPDEEIDFLSDGAVLRRLDQLCGQTGQLLQKAQRGRILNDGLRIAIAGAPNAGKSSLLNALSGSERAIVTAIPGTTRDVVSERLLIDGLPVELLDTAGLRSTEDPVEAEGVRRAQQELARADLVLWLVDVSAQENAYRPQTEAPVIKLYNKIDLLDRPAQRDKEGTIWLSAKAGLGLDILRAAILHHAGVNAEHHSDFSARARHVEGLQQVLEQLAEARVQLVEYTAGELLAEELKRAGESLGEIVGHISSDELLGEIFSSFCIGK